MSMFDAAEVDRGDAPAAHAGRRHLSERQTEVMERLIAAAAEEAEERPYGEISVRTIARRAGVAPATAYTYFSGKDHLLAEVLLQRAQVSPSLVDLTLSLPDRVADTARTMGFGAMGSAAVGGGTPARRRLHDGAAGGWSRREARAFAVGRRDHATVGGRAGCRRRFGRAQRAAGDLHRGVAERRHGSSRFRRRPDLDG
jgi:AcrR family transcriptional regulator